MVIPAAESSGETERLLRRASQGDQSALGVLLERPRARLRRIVALRLDRRLQGRIDPSDVIQEVQLAGLARTLRNFGNL